jgi:hypothetical protein
MKSFILFIFVIGLILLTTGYQKQLTRQVEVQKEIEYRFIPRSIYEEQMGQPQVSQSFADMFEKQDIFMTNPYNHAA